MKVKSKDIPKKIVLICRLAQLDLYSQIYWEKLMWGPTDCTTIE
jgi:hypothetical protein